MKKISKKLNPKKNKVPFSKLSKPKKRVEIAKDVLEQIKVKRYLSETGRYIYKFNFTEESNMDSMLKKDIQSNFTKIKDCKVCAMGACLMSATKFVNKLNFSDIGDSITDLNNDKVRQVFSSLFTPMQLLIIETSFEGGGGGDKVGEDIFRENLNVDMENKCTTFFLKYFNPEKRMIAIMKNIIRNKGTFKP